MIEDLNNFYENYSYFKKLRLISILLSIFMILITCIILVATSCEIGWRLKLSYCCIYKSPDCLSMICRKKRLAGNEISFTDYWRLYDPCYVMCVISYIILQIVCFAVTVIFGVNSLDTVNKLKIISKS